MLLQIILNGLINGCGYILIALGMSLVFGIINVINVAHNMFYTIGAYLFYTAFILLGLNFIVSVIFSVIITAFFSMIIERLMFRPLRVQGHTMQIIAANGLAILFLDGVRLVWKAESVRLSTPFTDIKLNLGNVVFTAQRLSIVIVTIFVVAALIYILNHTKFGLMMRALPQDNMAAKLNGINVDFVSGVTFAISTGIAAIGAVSVAPLYTLKPAIAESLGNKMMAIVILGGIGSIPGTVIAAIIVGLVEALIAGYIVSGYENLIIFSILILTLIFKPTGLLGRKQQ